MSSAPSADPFQPLKADAPAVGFAGCLPAETRYTEKTDLEQLPSGSRICVLSKAGHIAW